MIMAMDVKRFDFHTQAPSITVPRSVPLEVPSIKPTSDPSQRPPSRSTDRSPSRSMKIASLLNNDEDDNRNRRYSDPPTYHSHPPSISRNATSYYGWSPTNFPSPSDGTASFLDASDCYNDYGSPNANESRENRPAYLVEEDTFIWYHRDDRGMKWDEVSIAFNEYFPKDRQRHGLQGIQGRYYRILKDEGVPKLRSRQKKRPRRDYGVVARTSRRYAWMTQ